MSEFLRTCPLLFGMGLAGAVHCAGMCGGLAVLSGGAGRLGLWLYLAGKSCAYLFLGALAGAFGELVMRSAPFGIGSRVLALAAGLLLLALGLDALGLLRFPSAGGGWVRAVSDFVAGLASAPLVLGFANGLLPCPLTYAFAAMAAATGSALWGAAVMAVLSLTSAIPLALCVFAGRRVGWRLPWVTGVLMLVMAAITLYRGFFAAGAHHHMHMQ
jgi:sulfite exporter TauE/SafE